MINEHREEEKKKMEISIWVFFFLLLLAATAACLPNKFWLNFEQKKKVIKINEIFLTGNNKNSIFSFFLVYSKNRYDDGLLYSN